MKVENMDEKLKRLSELLQIETIKELHRDGVGCQENIDNCKTSIKKGRKYIKIDVGGSGKLMITKNGEIFGIKAYGVIHRGHYYGTLDTVDDYYWGEFYPFKKQVVKD